MNGTNKPRRRPSFGPKPVNEGDVYNIEIEGIGTKGDGIGRVKGFVVIVPGVAKGDKVDVKITAVRGKVAFGEKASGASKSKSEKRDDVSEPSEDADTETSDEETEDTDEESQDEETKDPADEDLSDDEPNDETADSEDEFEEK